MEATVGLENLAIDCIIGARDRERAEPQRIFVDVALEVDIAAAAASDDVAHAADYSRLAGLLMELARDHAFRLLERFVAVAAERVLEAFPEARAVSVTIKKPGAVPAAEHAFVRLRRQRS
jgi:7,8-dihydroneopterin aldolase/epimerase/oxygenase